MESNTMILITGGMGFVGLNTTKALLTVGEDIVLTTSLPTDAAIARMNQTMREPNFLTPCIGKRVFVETVDILNAEKLTEVGRLRGVTAIVHLVGGPMIGPLSQGLRDNMLTSLSMLEAASAIGVKRVVQASSIAIYAGVSVDAPWREDAPLPIASPHPMTAYKKISEICADYYSLRTNLNVVSVRFGAYGPLTRWRRFFLHRAVDAAVRGVPGPELTPGETTFYEDDNTGDWCYVADLASAITSLLLASTLTYSLYNVGSGKILSNRDAAEAVRRAVPNSIVSLQPGGSGSPINPPLDISRIQSDTGWAPQYTIDSGVAEWIGWLKAGNQF